MNVIEVRSKAKFFKYLAAGLMTHRMYYEKVMIIDPDGSPKLIYIIFYTQR